VETERERRRGNGGCGTEMRKGEKRVRQTKARKERWEAAEKGGSGKWDDGGEGGQSTCICGDGETMCSGVFHPSSTGMGVW
jgi:hypothetical protein